MLYHCVIRYEDHITIGVIVILRERRHHANRIANGDVFDRATHGINDAGRFIAKTRRELDRLDVLIAPPHRLGTVESDRFDLDFYLVRAGAGNRSLDELEHVGATCMSKLDCA